jgi:signal transduction histidine kinase/HD-like signal output (HDOD) protein
MDFDQPLFRQLSNVSHLPSLPHVLFKLIQTCNLNSSSLSDVSRIVETDPSLSSRLLRLVNSAHYGLPYRVESMHQAVDLIGMRTIKNLALCASVREVFHSASRDANLDLKGFWRHSLRCGLLARKLAETYHYDNPEEAFLCGLFHDIGKLVLWAHFGPRYSRLLAEAGMQGEELMGAELSLGATHPEVGAWMLQRWSMPSFMSDAVLYHHEPLSRISSAFPLVQIVYCAHRLCLADDEPEKNEALFKAVEKILAIPPEESQRILYQTDLELEEVAEALQIQVRAPSDGPYDTEKVIAERALLAAEVRNFSLLYGTMESLLSAQTQVDILRVLLEGIHILFDHAQALFFLFEEERNALCCADLARLNKRVPRAGNAISLDLTESLVVRCMLENRSLFSDTREDPFFQERPIVDDQIIHLLGKEGIYCLPMRASGEPVGVLVLAMDASDQHFFTKNANALRLFAKQGALALLTERLKRKAFEDVQKERLDAIYTLGRKISHEVKSPLNIIKNYLQILGLKVDDPSIAEDEIRVINEEIDRISTILDRLSTMSSQGERQASEWVDVNQMITDLAKITKESLSRQAGVTLQTELDPQVPTVSIPGDALKQVLINLIQNAAEAMNHGGLLTLRTKKHEVEALEDKDLANGASDLVEISVIDNGQGIPDDMRARLFEPFVGTKEDGHAGLGLSIVHSLIQSYGGQITCESNPAGGTTFKIILPVEKAGS